MFRVHRVVAPLLMAALVACSTSDDDPPSGPNNNPPPPPPPPSSTGLGDIASETQYFLQDGFGEFVVIQNPALQDCGRSSVDPLTGQRIIEMNPVALAQLSPVLQDFWYAHEVGHHYLDCVDGAPSKRNEYLADAYATRVAAELDPTGSAVAEIEAFWRTSNNPGDPTHASGVERAAYVRQVYDAFLADPTNVPEPPSTGGTPQLGTVRFDNPFTEPVFVFVNGQFAGGLNIGAFALLTLPAGPYEVFYQGAVTGGVIGPFLFQLSGGQVIRIP